jgi:hypothetical protein
VVSYDLQIVICGIDSVSWEAIALSRSLGSGVVVNILQSVAFCHQLFISFCLCITVNSAIIFSYVRVIKVLYIGRESDVIVTFVATFVSCLALIVEWGVLN